MSVHASEYGCCPVCGGHCVLRERRPHGNDTCENGHVYPSRSAVFPTQKQELQMLADVSRVEADLADPESPLYAVDGMVFVAELCCHVRALLSEIQQLRIDNTLIVPMLMPLRHEEGHRE